MKKFLFFLMAATMFTGAVSAKHNCGCDGCEVCKVEDKLRHKQQHKGGFMAVEATPVSVARILTLPDDTHVTVIGHITDRVGKGEYNFTDGSDNIVAEIGKKDWKGQIVSPQDKVILKGKVVRDTNDVTLDVKSVKVVN
ncbi:MAG: NirD/YgiW/YdeI family stress tolerance protein [Acetobacter sp.]|nr:NirD/YgiW/YdeI family stress tolerance protein [Acetobacter sp.]